MNIACDKCNSSYDLPDDRLPTGKIVSFPCPSCKNKLTIDLREGQTSEKLVFKPLDDSSESTLSSEDLKKKILNRIKDLPPMPKVLFKARQVMGDPKSGFKEIAKVIETDQAIAARVLKVANSAYYGLSGMVNSIHQASVVLGYQTLEQVITMVTSSSLLGKQLKGYNLNAGVLWKHSLAVALGSRMISQERAPSLEGDAFSVGLIHDAGKLALDQYIYEKRQDMLAFIKKNGPSFLQAERNILGFDHTEIAYDLCQKWKLPTNHVEAMRYHHNPEESGDNQLAHIVHIANYISKQAGFGSGPGSANEPLSPSSLEALHLKDDDIENLTAEVTSAVQKITESLNT